MAVHRVFQEHLTERDFWQVVADRVKAELETILRTLYIAGKVEGRAKTTGSVVGKCMRKPDRYADLSAFGDLAAARALVPFPSDVAPVAAQIHVHPAFTVLEDDIKRRSPESLQYQARHLELEIDWNYFAPESPAPRAVRCEVQIQTLAESLWASVSHLITYKRDSIPSDIHLRVNRLIVLCELFDDEAEISRDAALRSVDLVALISRDLDRYYSGITGSTAGTESSLEVLGSLVEALGDDERETYPAVLERFISDYGERLVGLLKDRPEARGNAWFVRPEAIFAFERITNRPATFGVAWDKSYATADREALEAAWGPID